MRPQFRVENDVIGRGRARTGGADFDPRIYIDEARRLQAEAVADAVRCARTAVAGAVRRLTHACRRLLLAVADGVAAARRYEKLAAMSDAELARLGITREDVAWFAYSGERPAQPGRGSGRPTPKLPAKKAANASSPATDAKLGTRHPEIARPRPRAA